MSQQTASLCLSRCHSSVWPGVTQSGNRHPLQSPTACILVGAELWTLREVHLKLEKPLVEDGGIPINQPQSRHAPVAVDLSRGKR